MALPILETSRLRLRPRTLADLEDCFRMDREAGTLDWIEWPGKTLGWSDDGAHREHIRSRTLHPYPPGMGYWVLAKHELPDGFLGWVMLIPADTHGPEIEIGWRLTGAARGRGFASEAARRVLHYGLVELGLGRVIADIHPGNAGSVRLARKIGMRDAGPAPGAPHLVRFEAGASCSG